MVRYQPGAGHSLANQGRRRPRDRLLLCQSHTDTACGWYTALAKEDQDFFRRYTNTDGKDAAWTLIRLAWSSVCDTAMTTLQDLLGLGSESRLNTPGVASGNWGWRERQDDQIQQIFDNSRELTELSSRAPVPRATEESPAS